MASRNKIDSCMFCTGECTCVGSPRKKAVKKTIASKPKPIETVELPEKPVLPAVPAPRKAAPLIGKSTSGSLIRSGALKRPERTTLQVDQAKLEAKEQEEKEWRRAITVLAASGLLHPDDIAKHRDEIDLPKWKVEVFIRQGYARLT